MQPNQKQSVYDRIAQSGNYKTTDGRLKIISWSVTTLSAISTAYVNGISHRDRIGTPAAIVLGILTFAIVEGTLFTLEDGMRETFKGGTQRLLAWLCQWVIRVTMLLNAAYLFTVISGVTAPEWLTTWNHWAFAVHFAVGLVMIPLIRNADPVIASRMLRLRAEMAQEDQINTRMTAAMASPFGMIGSALRGFLDGWATGWRIFRNKEGFSPERYTRNLNDLAKRDFDFIEGKPTQPVQIPPSPAKPLPALPPLPTPPTLPNPEPSWARSTNLLPQLPEKQTGKNGINGSNGKTPNP